MLFIKVKYQAFPGIIILCNNAFQRVTSAVRSNSLRFEIFVAGQFMKWREYLSASRFDDLFLKYNSSWQG
jgi:hypothetical protein